MRRDVDMLDRCWDMEFRFYEEKGIALVEKVEKINYMGRPMDQTGNYLPAV